ncbi:MAG: sugar porter family MFS transporter [Gammaproteobacteria bacterium]|nr:sugar porter family MFS transporter [Gammaproteobacteria bacterium]
MKAIQNPFTGNYPSASVNSFVIFVAIVSALGGLLFGFDTGVISGGLMFVKKTFHISTLVQEIIVSIVVAGALIGALVSGKLADYFGRKKLLMIIAIIFVIGTLMSALAPNPAWLIWGRFVLGLAIGVASYVVPLFISEVAPAKYRGSLVLLNAIMITGGETIAFLVDYALAPTESWRYMFGVAVFPAIALFVGMMLAPETPRWLVLKGYTEKARKILEKIRLANEVETELTDIKHTIETGRTDWKKVFSKNVRPVLILGLLLGILQQFSGINTVMYYGPTIFEHAGFHSAASQIFSTFGMGLVNTVMSIISVIIVDRLGRRKLLLTGLLVAAGSLALISIIFKTSFHIPYANWIALLCMIIYIAGYSISIGNLFWLIISEIYPLSVRSSAMSIVTAVQWGANFLVSMTFLTILELIGISYTFMIYGMMCALGVIFCYLFVPETKGVSLEKIEENLNAEKPLAQLGQPVELFFCKNK